MENNFPYNHFINIPKNNEQTPNPIQHTKETLIEANASDDSGFSAEELDFVSEQILEKLKDKIPQVKFNAFFSENLVLSQLSYGVLTFNVPTEYIKTVLSSTYLTTLTGAAKEVLGKDYTIKIDVKSSSKSLSSNDQNILKSLETASEEKTQPNIFNANKASFTIDLMETKEDKIDNVNSQVINRLSSNKHNYIVDTKKTFKNYVVGPSNNMAYASALAVAKNPGKVYPCLYLHSDSGLGKTHLLHAVANQIKAATPQLIICITTAREFMSEMVDAMANKDIQNFRKKYSEDIDILMIDDIHELKNKQGTQNEFFHVFNELHNKGKQLIFTSDKHPKDIDGIEERIKTRLTWGLVLDIQQPDLETRIAILKNKASIEDIYLPDDVINLIATRVKSNIRELEGSLIRLAAYSSVFNVDIDVEIAKEQLNLGNDKEQTLITVESVTKAVSQHFKIPIADLKSKTRLKDVAYARHIAMYLSYSVARPTPTYMDIGKYFGGRDHSSVLHGVDKIKKLSKSDQKLSQTLLEIENSL